MTARAHLRLAVAQLTASGIANAARDARILLAYAMGIGADRLTLCLSEELSPPQQQKFDAALIARQNRQPVAQIIGKRLFWGNWFTVTRDTLDPRPETETLVALALEGAFSRILDLGTGTGCILLSCLHAMPDATGVGVDVSQAALDVAQSNARDQFLDHRVQWIRSDWFSAVSEKFDLIVANPPYITSAEMSDLSPEVRDWEPHLALTSGGDGLDSYRKIAQEAGARLCDGGRILLEIGPTQGPAVMALLRQAGLVDVKVHQDMDQRDRVVIGHRTDPRVKTDP
jgi:release factor glutamine methyltransferase